ncbi:MAG: hypothetical protein ABJA93_07055, partial [Sporichthyaceae bacterium]
QVGLDAVGVGECELGECLFPVGGDLAFDQPAGGFALGGGAAAFFLNRNWLAAWVRDLVAPRWTIFRSRSASTGPS